MCATWYRSIKKKKEKKNFVIHTIDLNIVTGTKIEVGTTTTDNVSKYFQIFLR